VIERQRTLCEGLAREDHQAEAVVLAPRDELGGLDLGLLEAVARPEVLALHGRGDVQQ